MAQAGPYQNKKCVHGQPDSYCTSSQHCLLFFSVLGLRVHMCTYLKIHILTRRETKRKLINQ